MNATEARRLMAEYERVGPIVLIRDSVLDHIEFEIAKAASCGIGSVEDPLSNFKGTPGGPIESTLSKLVHNGFNIKFRECFDSKHFTISWQG